jgi:putative intracellular protease/amidase
MIIGIPVYDGVDLLDVTGPYEMFNWMKSSPGVEAEVALVAETRRPVTSRDGLMFRPFCGCRAATRRR